jgi:hypothetical protein
MWANTISAPPPEKDVVTNRIRFLSKGNILESSPGSLNQKGAIGNDIKQDGHPVSPNIG